MADERLYIVSYDIADDRRWRRVYRVMNGYGRWLQLSVFQCRLTPRRRQDMAAALEAVINKRDDHVLIIDVGPAEKINPRVESLGKTFESVTREAIIV
jgi:CRISPR-associated protein Cas2